MGVVFVTFCGMREDFIGFDDFAETVYGGRVGGMVWVILFYEVEVLFFDLLQGCITWEIEDFVGCWIRVCWPGNSRGFS